MAESLPVRCPACRSEHVFTPPTYSCEGCGTALSLPLLRGGVPVQVQHRSWEDSWVSLGCPSCGRSGQWPQPEFDCRCGATIRLPVDTSARGQRPAPRPASRRPARLPVAAAPPASRPPFRPVTIRTAADAVAAAAQYLKWLGFAEVRPSEDPARSGLDLRGTAVVAQVESSVRCVPLKDVECLWLRGLNENADCAFFALSGYASDARTRADKLGVPLFVMDLTGTPQPVNEVASQLIRTGAPTA